MPRDGSGIYTLPHTPVVDGTTIESAVHNNTMNDIALQLNGPLPIIAGGTGANNAHDAMIALSGEISGQVVTNYDSFPFVNGSFWSAPGATGEPEAGTYISGICHGSSFGAPTLEARSVNSGTVYTRSKVGAVWGAWVQQSGSVADLDARYVNLTGDSMSGPLQVPVKGSLFGLAFGSGSVLAPPKADANIRLYDNGGDNWAGIGTDGSGHMWFRTGISGTPLSAMYINAADQSVNVNSTAASGSPTTGALTVAGGVGVAGAANIGGASTIKDITQGTPATYPGDLRIAGTTQTTLQAQGGVELAVADGYGWKMQQLSAGGAALAFGNRFNANWTERVRFTAAGDVNILNTTASISAATGALTVAGGVGVAGAVWATNTTKVFGLMDAGTGKGVSYNISSTTDGGVGYVDIGYGVTFPATTSNVPVVSVTGASTNITCNTGLPSTSTIRIHAITATTGALIDPTYYQLHVMGVA